ncbi:MAG: trypsin-like serine protease, partial [Verrucomicrobia bacterium]|nr:trypsin-like serine protease [Verrucomicrobiota bacterium]
MNKAICIFSFSIFFGSVFADQRRIGKRHDLSWTPYYQLGTNFNLYESSEAYPDLSIVGALISKSGALGTGTLIAPNYVVTAAHVLKNDYYEIPDKFDWEFVMYYDFGDANSVYKYQVDEIIIHPAWSARQTTSNTLGDG